MISVASRPFNYINSVYKNQPNVNQPKKTLTKFQKKIGKQLITQFIWQLVNNHANLQKIKSSQTFSNVKTLAINMKLQQIQSLSPTILLMFQILTINLFYFVWNNTFLSVHHTTNNVKKNLDILIPLLLKVRRKKFAKNVKKKKIN